MGITGKIFQHVYVYIVVKFKPKCNEKWIYYDPKHANMETATILCM